MNEVERELRAMLDERARNVEGPRSVGPAVRRARRRRLATAGTAAVVSLCVVSGAVAAIQGLDDGRRSPAPAAPGQVRGFVFTSSPADYPFVATGRFRNVEWKLRAAAVVASEGADIRMSVEVRAGDWNGAASYPVRAVDSPVAALKYDPGHGLGTAAVAFGAVAEDAARVDVELEDGATIPAHLFTGHDARTGAGSGYFVVFLPGDAQGWVVARDAEGAEVARQRLSDRP